jgi:hypothetical protein
MTDDRREDEMKTERVIVPVPLSMLDDIKEYWHEHRLNSKSEAIRRLIEAGLKAEGRKTRK